MKIVVTGGAGFIGDHVVKHLRSRGYDPFVFDHRFGMDVRDLNAVRSAVKGARGVIHLAGVLGTEELFQTPQHAVRVNVEGGTNVIVACVEQKAVFVNITMPHVWENIYQATKKSVESIATAYHRNFHLRVCNVRAFNVFGEGQKVGSPQKIIPTFSDRAWRGLPLPIWGDGQQKVDLIYVEDVARVLVDALEFHDNRTIDAGTGFGTTVLRVADVVREVTGNDVKHEYLPMRLGEVKTDVVAQGEGWHQLGWRPSFSNDDLIRTIESYHHV